MKRPSLVKSYISLCLAATAPMAISETSGNSRQAKPVLEEVFVTATKRSESLRDLPISIDAFSGTELEERGATGLEEILQFSPGVVFRKGGHADSSSITIRGIGSTSKYQNRAFGLFYQDVSLVNPSLIGPQPDIDPFDMASVEVLKGPQGTLFGGSALAGAVRYVPSKPDLADRFASISYDYASVEESEENGEDITAMINQPLGEHVGIRFAGSVRHRAGYVDDLHSGEQDINSSRAEQLQGHISWLPSDAIGLHFSHLKRSTDSDDAGAVDFDNNDDNRLENSQKRSVEDAAANASISSLTLDLNLFEAFSISLTSSVLDKDGFVKFDGAAFYGVNVVPGIRTVQLQDYESSQTSHELRLVSNDISDSSNWLLDNWKYVVGVFQTEVDQRLFLDIPVPSFNAGGAVQDLQALLQAVPLLPDVIAGLPTEDLEAALFTDANVIAKERALYFDVSRYLFDERLEINVGGRFFEQDTQGDVPVFVDVRLPLGVPSQAIPLKGADASLEESGFNPKLALTWRQNDNVMVFASAVKGFRFGGVNIDPLITGEPEPTFESDELMNYELGVRTNWLDGALHIDATAYYLVWDNMQVEEFVGLGIYAYILNVGGSTNEGGEFSMKAALPYGFMIAANAAYSKAQLSESFSTPSGGEGKKGDRLPVAPLWTGSIVFGHSAQLENWRLSSELFYSYQHDSKNDFENHIPLASFDTFGLAFNVANTSLPLAPEFKLTVSNLEDERAPLFAVYESNGIFTHSSKEILKPRTITAGIKLNF
ncbi:MAG: TonB-dependent receptor [Spongiibacteraceae bacterium]